MWVTHLEEMVDEEVVKVQVVKVEVGEVDSLEGDVALANLQASLHEGHQGLVLANS